MKLHKNYISIHRILKENYVIKIFDFIIDMIYYI